MEESTPKFDVDDGGNINLPPHLNFVRFVESRIEEIKEITKAIEAPKGNGLVFQRLPRHMRRRVMGHTSKRMPRTVQEAHIKQLKKSGYPPKSKRPSRRYRRRPTNLLSEYNRRQRTFMWLETHIWHAKRFHMIEKWGYKLALHPNDKSVRACYRASSQHCLLHDMSYLVCMELEGPQTVLVEHLSRLCSTECGLTFAAKSLLGGHREGKLMMYHPDKFPYKAIGNVDFIWKPQLDTEDSRNIWLWSHPSYYVEVLEALREVFSLEECERSEQTRPEGDKVETKKLETRLSPLIYKTSQSRGVTLTLLKDSLVRFRLTGPLSQAILQAMLIPAPELREEDASANKSKDLPSAVTPMDIDDIFSSILEPKNEKKETKTDATMLCEGWFGEVYSNSDRLKEGKSQSELWSSLQGVTTPAQLPPHCVLGLTIIDPRVNLPGKRTKALPGNVPAPNITSLPPLVSQSPIWDMKVRDVVTSSKISDFELNAQRSALLVPSTEMTKSEEKEATKLPVLLIQKPGSQDASTKRIGLGCGWDLVAPLGWGQPLWRCLIMQGARPGGLRELEALATETLHHYDPIGAPDTVAGQQEQQLDIQQSKDEFFKRPPAKRPNFIKMGISHPFGAPWSQLLHEWSGTRSKEFYINRNISKLNRFRECFSTVPTKSNSTTISSQDPQSLISVAVKLTNGGALDSWALICLPENESDLTTPLKEQNHVDEKEKERKELKEKHQSKLKKLRRERVKAKRNGKTPNADDAKVLAEKHDEKMKELWLPEVTSVKDCCSRKLLGLVTQGSYSFSEGRSAGVGFITEPGLITLLQTKSWNSKIQVLVRNKTTLQYRVAQLIIL